MTESANLSPAFQQALDLQRESLNARFRERMKRGSQIDSAEWMRHVRNRLGPIVDAVESTLPERTRLATSELYDVSLDLFAAGFFGEETKIPQLAVLWDSILPRLNRSLAREPRQVAGSLSNALVFIHQTAPQAASRWLELIGRIGPEADSVEQLLNLGKFAAWISGLAQYRPAALRLAQTLPKPLVARMLDIPSRSAEEVGQILAQLELDPWAELKASSAAGGAIKFVAECCSFRGFGGCLMSPPRVALHEGLLCVTDEASVWQLFADRFGWTVQRLDVPLSELRIETSVQAPKVERTGTIVWDRERLPRPDLVGPSSHAFDGKTLAVTIPTSFHVFLFARPTSFRSGV